MNKQYIYNISISGYGGNKLGSSYYCLRTIQGSFNFCMKELRKNLCKATKEFELKSSCFHKINYQIHISRIDNDFNNKIKNYTIQAINVLKYRNCDEV